MENSFLTAAEKYNDEAAKKILQLIEKCYQEEEEEIAKKPDGDRHLGRACARAQDQFQDYLIDEAFWELPYTSRLTNQDPTMLETKFWILETLIRAWTPKITERSKKVFRFLIATFRYPEINHSEQYPFESDNKGWWTSKKEQNKILELIRKQNQGFNSEKLEKWMELLIYSPHYLPYQIEEVLAIARTRNGGHKLWRSDIKNSDLVKFFRPHNRSEAAIKLFKNISNQIAGLDVKVKDLIKKMRNSGYTKRYEIGDSEYVPGTIKFELTDLEKVRIFIILEEECSKQLSLDIHCRACKHIKPWAKQNKIKGVLETYKHFEKTPFQRFDFTLYELL